MEKNSGSGRAAALAAASCALLAGCAAIFETPPASGGYARLKISKMDDSRLAVAIVRIRKVGFPSLGYEPRDEKPQPMLWLYPGDYLARLQCNRPYPAPDGTQIATIGSGDEADRETNFSFSVEAAGSYQLDCTSSADSDQFVLTPMPKDQGGR